MLGLLACSLLLGAACRSARGKDRPVKVIYINRGAALSPEDRQALAVARAETGKWDTGLEVTDHRVQRHRQGWTVSLLLRSGYDDAGQPIFPAQPIRNIEVNRAFEVVGYHISQ